MRVQQQRALCAIVIPEVAQRLSGTQGPRIASRAGSRLFAIARCANAAAGMTVRGILAALVLLPILLTPAHAVEPGEMLKDPALEARARKLSQELRCVVCQNQSIDDSNAPLAHDLRVLVRERLAAGDSDAQVLSFVEARYGAFVLLRPRFTLQTLLLWLTPLLLLAGAGVFLWRARTRTPAAAATQAPLTPEEQRRLDALLRQDGSGVRGKTKAT
jgi:cytochrome c-type biogenesis protein CcmH